MNTTNMDDRVGMVVKNVEEKKSNWEMTIGAPAALQPCKLSAHSVFIRL